MQYTTTMISAMAVAYATAAPMLSNSTLPLPECSTCEADDSIFVKLRQSTNTSGLLSDTLFQERLLPDSKNPVKSFGPFTTVALELGAGVHNKDLRCQIHDEYKEPIVVFRNGKLDTTFSDQGKGAWTLWNGEQEVCDITCDASFVAKPIVCNDCETTPPCPDCEEPKTPETQSPPIYEDKYRPSVEVSLSYNNASATVTTFAAFDGKRKELPIPQHSGPFNTVRLNADEKTFDKLRCKLYDDQDHAILLQRKDNTDITFSDGGAQAPWYFLCKEQQIVSKVVCDLQFKPAIK